MRPGSPVVDELVRESTAADRVADRVVAFLRSAQARQGPFYLMAGFSGHGLMHGPVVGSLMAEEILDGRAHTVNIDPFRYDRFLEGELDPEYNVV